MRALRLITPMGLVVALSLPGWAQQSTLTEEKFEAAMKEIDYSVGDVIGHIQARYWPELGYDADTLTSFLTQVEGFWKARKNEKAAGIVQEALTAVEGLRAAVAKRDSDGAKSALSELRSTCQSCHKEFREKTQDGYRIKPGT